MPGLDRAGVDLLNRMLVYVPHKRITAKDALSHEYFHDIQRLLERGVATAGSNGLQNGGGQGGGGGGGGHYHA